MRLICLGFSYHTTPIELREGLGYSPETLAAALDDFARARTSHGFGELVILSTCNRLELYACVPAAEARDGAKTPQAELLGFLMASRGLSACELDGKYGFLADEAAALHLCRVAAGL